jgi:hypothetical protein
MDGAQVAVDGAVADPLSVLGSLFDGVAEVPPDKDAREPVLLGCFGESDVGLDLL